MVVNKLEGNTEPIKFNFASYRQPHPLIQELIGFRALCEKLLPVVEGKMNKAAEKSKDSFVALAKQIADESGGNLTRAMTLNEWVFNETDSLLAEQKIVEDPDSE